MSAAASSQPTAAEIAASLPPLTDEQCRRVASLLSLVKPQPKAVQS